MNKPKFVIVSNRPGFGGPIVLYKLCSLLNQKGYNARIFPSEIYYEDYADKNWKTKLWYWSKLFLYYNSLFFLRRLKVKLFPNSKFSGKEYKGISYVPVRGCKYKILPFVDKNTIVVYPEVIYGNPLHAKHVVRYMLSKTNMYDDLKSYGKEDIFFCYREIFNDVKRNPQKRTLSISHFDLDLYKQTNFGERHGNCYVIRKGRNRSDIPSSFEGPIVDDLTEPEIVDTFNKCEKVYLYDMQTAYASIAALCGCIPISVLEPGKKKSDYFGKDDPEPFGRAFDDTPEEIEYAIQTRAALRERFENRERENIKEVEKFINECKCHFNIQ